MTVQNIKLNFIHSNPFQTRQREDPEHIQKLAESIKREGLLQIPLGRYSKTETGVIELAFGHSRLAACKWLAENENYIDEMPVALQDLTDEEMFTRAVAENHERKDLSPIETAKAMVVFRDRFGKNSTEIGELFHLSSSAVRNKIRLLELPNEAQEKIDQGMITEGSARSLLQLQRVAPEKVTEVVETASEDRLTAGELENKTSEAISSSDNAYLMYESWHSGPPKAGSDLWILSEWAPNIRFGQGDDYKEIFSILRTVNEFEVLEYEDFAIMLQLFENDPIEWEQKYSQEYNYSPRALEVFQVMAEQYKTCSVCPLHVVKKGNHYCGFKPCWNWRKDQYEKQVLAEKSEELGIAIYSRQDGKYDRVEKYDTWEMREYLPAIKKLFESWIKDNADCLRLKIHRNRYSNNSFTNDPMIAIVCVGEEAIGKIQELTVKIEKPKKMPEWEKQRILGDASEKFLKNVAAVTFGQVFDVLPLGFFQWFFENTDDFPKEGLPEEKLIWGKQHFAYWIIDRESPYSEQAEGPVHYAQYLQGIATTIGIELPANWLEVARAYEPDFGLIKEKQSQEE